LKLLIVSIDTFVQSSEPLREAVGCEEV
jgi:hypothetical protein